jgi:uncharacterized membrane protein
MSLLYERYQDRFVATQILLPGYVKVVWFSLIWRCLLYFCIILILKNKYYNNNNKKKKKNFMALVHERTILTK